MTEHAKSVAARLQEDIDLLVGALRALESAITQLEERSPNDGIHIHVSDSLALWAHYHFNGNWSAFVDFADQALMNWHRDKRRSWVIEGPERENPEPEAVRHRDRVYMGLQFISKELNSPVPFHVERSWFPRENAERLQIYVRAANDVLNPETA
jgi:hypothetical protein